MIGCVIVYQDQHDLVQMQILNLQSLGFHKIVLIDHDSNQFSEMLCSSVSDIIHLRVEADGFPQSALTNLGLRILENQGCEWGFVLDSDEILVPVLDGKIKICDLLSKAESQLLHLPVFDFVQSRSCPDLTLESLSTFRWAREINRKYRPGKIAFRFSGATGKTFASKGNHLALNPLKSSISRELFIFHIPWSSSRSLSHRMRHGSNLEKEQTWRLPQSHNQEIAQSREMGFPEFWVRHSYPGNLSTDPSPFFAELSQLLLNEAKKSNKSLSQPVLLASRQHANILFGMTEELIHGKTSQFATRILNLPYHLASRLYARKKLVNEFDAGVRF